MAIRFIFENYVVNEYVYTIQRHDDDDLSLIR